MRNNTQSTLGGVLIACLAFLGAGCGGSGAPGLEGKNPAQQNLSGPAADALLSDNSASQPEPNQAELDAQWQAILRNPGQAGVDYDPKNLMIEYVPGLRSASGLPLGSAKLAEGARAAEQPNAILRQRPAYEVLTDAIAAAYSLKIDQQAYIGQVNLASFDVPEGVDAAKAIAGISKQFAGQIQYVTYSRLCHAQFVPSDPLYVNSTATSGDEWGHRRMGCSAAWDVTTGDPEMLLSVVDTGVNINHFELNGTVLNPEVEFPTEECDVANGNNTVEDNFGHGTFIAGLIGAEANNAGMVGAAYGCRIIPIKIANGMSAAVPDMISGCLLAMQLGAKVVNLSWGSPSPAPPLKNMCDTLVNNNTLLVGAAGNDNTTSNDYPGAYSNCFCVGATNKNDGRSSFSNYGSYVDIAAPGQELTSTYNGDNNNLVTNGEGTSFAAPLVAAGAALVWCAVPDMPIADLRTLFISTGQPTTGFVKSGDISAPLNRLDLAAAFAGLNMAFVTAPRPDKLVQSGVLSLTAAVSGTPDRVQVYFNGNLVDTKTAAPWTFTIDTTVLQFGTAQIEFRATKAAAVNSDFLTILIDNTAAVFPILDGFDSASTDFAPIEVKGYSTALLDAMFGLPAEDWSEDSVDNNGPAAWGKAGVGQQSGSGVMVCAGATGGYGAYELDALVSQALELPETNPSLVYYQHYNIEDGDSGQGFDRGYILVSDDNGASWAPATKKGGGTAYYSGYQAQFAKTEVDLADFAGKTVHLAFVLESDDQVQGQEAAQPAGWWVDSIVIASNFSTDVPTIGGVSLTPYDIYGDVPALPSFSVSVSDPKKVARVIYVLDCAPLGVDNLYDQFVSVDTGVGFPSEIILPTLPKMPNQVAQLRVKYFDSINNPGPEVDIPFYIFNLPGDVNADNEVNQADLDLYKSSGQIGLDSGDSGYIPFYDSDLDGLITEADASAVGYHWGDDI